MNNNPIIELNEDVLIKEEISINKKIVVYNDEVTSFDTVIECLVEYCKHDYEQAEQCAWIIHTKGKYPVKSGNYGDLKPIKDALIENGLDAKIEE